MELISFFIKERTDKVVLDLQEDLVTKNKDLIDTEAGKEARGQLAEGVEQTRRELEDTKAELREALRTRNKDMALKLSKERVDSSNKMEKLQKDCEIFRENMQQEFEEANKRQEAKIRGLIQENNTLKTAKNGTDNKQWSHWTIQFESTPQLSGLTSPSGSTAQSTRSSRLTSQVAKNFQRASPQNPQSPYLLFPEPMKIPIPLNPQSPFLPSPEAMKIPILLNPQSPLLPFPDAMKIPIPLHDNIDGIDIHSIIDRLAKVRGFQPVRLHYKEIRWLCAGNLLVAANDARTRGADQGKFTFRIKLLSRS